MNPSKEKSTVGHKLLTVIGTVLCIILIPILIINITLIAKSFTNKEDVPNFAGYLPLIVLTDSMYPVIESGDLIICHTVDAEAVETGDVIAFFDPAGNGTSIVTHRVTEIVRENGELLFRTKGDNNNAEDRTLVPADNLVAAYRTRIPKAGNVAMFMQTSTGLIICVVLPIVLLVGYDVIRRRKYEKSKQSDNAALLAELQALRAENAAKAEAAANAQPKD